MIRNTVSRYGAVAKAFHWLTLAAFILMFSLAWYMEGLPFGPDKAHAYNLHKSIGVAILIASALRLAWRWTNPAPPLPTGTPGWERLAAHLSHFALYLILFVMPVSGLVKSWAAGYPVNFFGIWAMPSLVGPNETVKEAATALHYWLSWFAVALVAVHAAAAIKHHVMDRDDVLKRMLPFAKP